MHVVALVGVIVIANSSLAVDLSLAKEEAGVLCVFALDADFE